MPGRTIVVAQSSLECAALRFAASELAKEGDAVLLVHAAAVLPPSSTVLHSAPQTVFTVPGDVNVSELHEKVTRTVKKKVLPCAEGTGAQVALQVKLLETQAPPRDAADAIIAAAREAGATVLVVSRGDSGGGGATPGTPRATTPTPMERFEDNPAADESGSGAGAGNVLGKVAADVARARANTGAAITRLVKGSSLADELLRRSGEQGGLAVVLVPSGWGEDDGGGAAAPAGTGAEAQAQA